MAIWTGYLGKRPDGVIYMKKYREALLAIGAVALLYGIFYIAGIGCPIKFITGLSCAGCGMTRAYLSLLKLDFAEAFYYHPLFMLPPLALLLVLIKKRLPGKLYLISMFTITGAFLIIYLVRLFDPNDMVVVFEPKEGLFYRIIVFVGGVFNVL